MSSTIKESDYLKEDGTKDYQKIVLHALHYEGQAAMMETPLGAMHGEKHKQKMIADYKSMAAQLRALDDRKPIELWRTLGRYENELIVGGTFEGNLGGCERYAISLRSEKPKPVKK